MIKYLTYITLVKYAARLALEQGRW